MTTIDNMPGSAELFGGARTLGVLDLDWIARVWVGPDDTPVPAGAVTERAIAPLTSFSALQRGDQWAREAVADAADELGDRGVDLVSGSCGFLAQFQQEIAEHSGVPTLSSALLVLPLVRRIVPPDREIAVLTACSSDIDERMLAPVGAWGLPGIVVKGLEDKEHFHSVIHNLQTVMDQNRIRAELHAAVRELLDDHPAVGALVFECTCFPAHAQYIRETFSLPVFDLPLLIDFVLRALDGFPGASGTQGEKA
ncbi:hypothetical protein GCM10009785_10740 [Brooklawnia cerclae]|uniref:Aspartate/glutamate racemase family protein n=1 Tax=Brooklawnia cerclae TaxID=349934 RepID=A0ABX0SJU1_9ACTN|nr:hypothetical protein [Brooklawnia cerclae]NIH58697.1 hypothetical protein [Brooklawnia cerclae]